MRLTLFRQMHDILKPWYATYGLRFTNEVQEVGIPVRNIWSTKELHWVEITVRDIWSTNELQKF